MYLNKVHDQKVEYLRTAFRNYYLKEKCNYLDSECKMLADNVLNNQVDGKMQQDCKDVLEVELEKLRRLNDEKLQALAIAQEKIASLTLSLEKTQTSVSNNKEQNSIDEVLEMKDAMIKCLQEELIDVRLKEAEKFAEIRELKLTKNELEKDKETLTKIKPETIARLQQELMEIKLRETQNSLEFTNIKNHLAQIKSAVVQQKSNEKEKEGNVKISKKGAIWKNKSKSDEEAAKILEKIKVMEVEKVYMQSKIPELENKIEFMKKHIEFKETEKRRLQEKLDESNLNYSNLQNLILERKRQCDNLEAKASERMSGIRNSSEGKVQNIEELGEKLSKIKSGTESTSTNAAVEKEDSIIRQLEEKILFLEKEIAQLQNEQF